MTNSLRVTLTFCVIAAAVLGALAGLTAVGVDRIERAHPPSGRFVEVEGGCLHLVELGAADAPPVVLLHGASANLGDMRLALGERLAASYRVILIDRPGHGWSDRPGGRADASPVRQAKLVQQALARIGITRAILVAHSWSGALATAFALDYPQSVAGLVLLAPVTHPRPMSIAWHDSAIKAMLAEVRRIGEAPVVGPLFVRALTLPLGKILIGSTLQSAFAPQTLPTDYLARAGAELTLRPSEFIANAQDLKGIEEDVVTLAPRYGTIAAPTVILTGDRDEALVPDIHAKATAAVLPRVKLVVLPGAGHMVHFAAPERVIEAITEIAIVDARDAGRAALAGNKPARTIAPAGHCGTNP